MKELFLVFLFLDGQVSYSSFGSETITPVQIEDTQENETAFTEMLDARLPESGKNPAKVCAVVPSYMDVGATPLNKLLFDRIGVAEEVSGKTLSIWEEQKGAARLIWEKSGKEFTFEDATKYCKIIAPRALAR